MPPPPPPSASYLWRFDDLSDDEEEEDDGSTSPVSVASSTISNNYNNNSSKSATAASDKVYSNSSIKDLGDRERIQAASSPHSSPLRTVAESIPIVNPVKPTLLAHNSSSHTLSTMTLQSNSSASSPRAVLASNVEAVVADDCRTNNDSCDTMNTSWTTEDPIDENGSSYREETQVAATGAAVGLNDHDSTDDEDDVEHDGAVAPSSTLASSSSSTSSSRKRKTGKKKKKKRKAHSSVAATATTVATKSAKRSVSFSQVNVLSFARCLGVSVVPGDGGWPLGIEATADVVADASQSCESSIPIEDYERCKQERLRQRLATMVSSTSTTTTPSTLASLTTLQKASHLESRQWDYKRQCRNPLFGSLSETDRMTLLLTWSTLDDDGDTGGSGLGDFMASDKGRSKQNGRRVSRSNSHNSAGSASSHHSASAGNTAGNSSHSNGGSNGGEHYNDVFTALDVRHVRNELEQLRNQRSMEGATGCNCRKLQVYLLPSTSSTAAATKTGKKANHRRMKLAKVKEELRKRKLLPDDDETTPREVLELLLHEAVESEPCCSITSGCSCARNGIECQADTCSCWYASHQITPHHGNGNGSTTTTTDASCSADEIRNRCGNPVAGMYAVDFAKIDAFRSNVLSTMKICPEIKG